MWLEGSAEGSLKRGNQRKKTRTGYCWWLGDWNYSKRQSPDTWQCKEGASVENKNFPCSACPPLRLN